MAVLAGQGLRLARRVLGGRCRLWASAGASVAVLLLLEIPGCIAIQGLQTGDVALLQRWAPLDALLRASH